MGNDIKHLIMICEGQTEVEFGKDVLISHFKERGLFVQFVLPKKSGGGIIPWGSLKREIKLHLGSSNYVTTFIDFYKLKKDYPFFDKSSKQLDKVKSVAMIENGMSDEINNYRFIPYIQLHEFEGLLFSDISTFRNSFSTKEANIEELEKIIKKYPNPEFINDGEQTAPSKRLMTHIKGYNKIVYGSRLASDLGLPLIRSRCPRFNDWIKKLENIN